MRVAVIGSGGREHCICWKLKKDGNEVFCIPGNAGITRVARCEKISTASPFESLIDFVNEKKIDITLVGPEVPLVDGIIDIFESKGLKIFGPSKAASQIEGSKSFAKDVMFAAGVPTGRSETFDTSTAAIKYLDSVEPPYVIKADGLAAGKGVSVFHNKQSTIKHIHTVIDEGIFGTAGKQIIIEEFLQGEEASVLAFTDGETVLQMESAQDHKAIYDGDKGPNTGGMGAYSPAPIVTPQILDKIYNDIFKPTIKELQNRGIRYKGILYAGLMITKEGPKVIEFNCRFGDPETQALLPRLDTNLVEVVDAAAKNRLSEITLKWRQEWAVCVIAASGGYPGDYKKGYEITGLDNVEDDDENTIIFHAGTEFSGNKTVTSGGRVLGVTTLGKDIHEAIERNYSLLKKIHFQDIYYRKDIGYRVLR